MTDIKCECGESMDLYDEQVLHQRKENYFICHSCDKKKKQVIVYNEQGAELCNDITDD